MHVHTHPWKCIWNCKQLRRVSLLHLWGDETQIRGFHFEKQYTYYGILPAREIASSSPLARFSPIPPLGEDDLRACLTQSGASLLCTCCVSVAVCTCVCVCVWIHVYLSKEKHQCVLLQDEMLSCKPRIPSRVIGGVTRRHQSPSHVSNPSLQKVERVEVQTAFQHLWAPRLVCVDGKQNFWWKAGPSAAESAEVTSAGCSPSLTPFLFLTVMEKSEGYKIVKVGVVWRGVLWGVIPSSVCRWPSALLLCGEAECWTAERRRQQNISKPQLMYV